MRIIGVGFGRTGTRSLRVALERLGAGPCLHMQELSVGAHREREAARWLRAADGETVDWHEMFTGWQSTVDWPACSRWREVCAAFPDAPVLLNHRDFDGFYRSAERTIWAVRQAARAGTLGPRPDGEVQPAAFRHVLERLVWQGDFQGRFEDRAWMERMYDQRLAAIRAEIPAGRLVEWRLGHDGWEPLARALGVPVPDEPFPHLHHTAEFREQVGLGQSAT
ncbi:sulfotransferase family protein [Asanoa siamensis]|uniref:Sulfotransferase family protein n=1 Tax=Asanoa siamensis TaxID=926357 RepID=A0ABQ4CUE8_9ACTN|nr:sulfotransferase family protein [Asanoa siamensis]GIF74890.1 sulfotransferase family protein [Asanoa siamensis]